MKSVAQELLQMTSRMSKLECTAVRGKSF